jgi:hypothetical protein
MNGVCWPVLKALHPSRTTVSITKLAVADARIKITMTARKAHEAYIIWL